MNDQDNVRDLFDEAVDDGHDAKASQVMVANLDTVALAGCAGTEIDLIPTDEVTLVVFVHDGSGSMSGDEQAVITAYKEVIDAFKGSKTADSILVSDWIFNTQRNLAHGFVPVAQVPDFASAYHTMGGTALYDTVLAALTGLVAYGQQLRSNGVRTKNVVIVFSDGEDNSSHKDRDGSQTRQVAKALLDQETFILAYVGFTNGTVAEENYVRRLADVIGFTDVITAKTGASGIRKIFQQVSASVIRASQNKVSSGGFFAP
jgi:hypothetical protein